MPIPSRTLRVLDAVIPPKRLLPIPAGQTEPRGPSLGCQRDVYSWPLPQQRGLSLGGLKDLAWTSLPHPSSPQERLMGTRS